MEVAIGILILTAYVIGCNVASQTIVDLIGYVIRRRKGMSNEDFINARQAHANFLNNLADADPEAQEYFLGAKFIPVESQPLAKPTFEQVANAVVTGIKDHVKQADPPDLYVYKDADGKYWATDEAGAPGSPGRTEFLKKRMDDTAERIDQRLQRFEERLTTVRDELKEMVRNADLDNPAKKPRKRKTKVA